MSVLGPGVVVSIAGRIVTGSGVITMGPGVSTVGSGVIAPRSEVTAPRSRTAVVVVPSGAMLTPSPSFSLSATSTVLMTCGVAEMYKRSSSSRDATSTRGEVRYSLSSQKALSASSD